MKYVIIGNGPAGVHAAQAIREMDSEGHITMIGDEAVPYCRPMISLLLEGSVQPDKLPIRGSDFYDKLQIRPVLGKRITGIDTDKKTVFIEDEVRGEPDPASYTLMGLICKLLSIITGDPIIDHKKISRTGFEFDRLLIATGADPRPVKADGLNLKNIFYMRTQAHVSEMINALDTAKHALVLGGGLVGFKAAYGLMGRGLDVTMAVGSDYPLSMQVDEIAGKMILDTLTAHGLNMKVGAEVKRFEGSDRVEKACLSDGTTLPCDMVVIGKGVLPALSFVPRDKIHTDLGILVDQYMETNIPGIFAAGDVAESVDIARKTRWVNAIWPEAVNQGRIAGMAMTGRQIAYKGSLSRNVIRIFDTDVMTAGLVNPPDDPSYEIITRTDPRKKTYRKLIFQEDKLVGMVLVNNIEQGGILMSLIQSETPVKIPKKFMVDALFNFRRLM